MNRMPSSMTLVPAYGRDYSSEKDVLAGWYSDADFIIADVNNQWAGLPVSRSQVEGDIPHVVIRFNQVRKFVNPKRTRT